MMMIRLTLLACAIAHASAQKADKTSSPTAAKAGKSLSLDAKAGKSMSIRAVPMTSAMEFGHAVHDTKEFVDSLVWVEDKETKVVGSTRKGAPKADKTSSPTAMSLDAKAGKSMSIRAVPMTSAMEFGQAVHDTKEFVDSLVWVADEETTVVGSTRIGDLEAPTQHEHAEVNFYLGGSNGVAAGGKSAKAGKGASMGSISAKSQKGTSSAKAEKSGYGVPTGVPGAEVYTSESNFYPDWTGEEETKAYKSPGAKSGKSDTKSSEYWLSPFNCPGDCITAQNYDLSEQLLEDAVATCDASDEYQPWKVHEQGGFVKFESADQYDANMCLSVVSEWAGDFSDADLLCSGSLGLVNCTLAMASWYFTGGRFLSAYCWKNGHSVALTVDKNCTELSVSSEADAIESESSQTFMVLDQDFIQTITDYV